jgi:class 3 adenylate cyclase/HAMP domain-containing protein
LAISVFSIVAAATALYSLFKIGGALDRITTQSSPAAIISLELSRQAEKVVTAAPALLTATSPEEKQRLSAIISDEVADLDRILTELTTRNVRRDWLQSIEQAVEQLGSNLQDLDSLISTRLSIAQDRQSQRSRLLDTHRKAQRLLDPWIRVQENKLKRLRKSLASTDLESSERPKMQRELEDLLSVRAVLQATQRFAATIYESLLEAATSKQRDRIAVLTVQTQKTLRSLNGSASQLETKLAASLEVHSATFRDLLEGNASLPTLRLRELDAIGEAERLLEQNRNVSKDLTFAVDGLVAAVKTDIANATVSARGVQHGSALALAVVVALSLLSSALIGLYLARSLIARLTGLSDSMLAIAHGDLDVDIPHSGYDEIGRMADALEMFRATAKDVRETNLQEIQRVRARLIDAIESISEGFSLYDSNDQLVICNSMYRTLLYPGMADEIEPGMTFVSVIRRAAARGYIEDAQGRVEEWVEQRMARHLEPGGSHVQRRQGRWIMVSERKTEDGGTVAVYSDITTLKEREEELAEKSGALESLSNQLAKYLSPQVYDSIFTGKQEVKIASRRKKLTVFFSDIANFTETADKLESEELTQLLNHYLTEMSQIALDHGATIDKYVGDAIVIFFGDPETKGVKEDALVCVKMAIAMRRRMQDLEGIWRDSGIENPLRCRMGVHTDYCTVGNFGSETRMDYTIIGGGVNLASRLETAAIPGEILISYETYAHVSDQIFCEAHGKIDVKGIAYPVATYQVLDSYENLGRQRRHFREDHPNVKLDLDLEAMTSDDREQAASVLRRALGLLSPEAHPGQPVQTSNKDSVREELSRSKRVPGAEPRKAREGQPKGRGGSGTL